MSNSGAFQGEVTKVLVLQQIPAVGGLHAAGDSQPCPASCTFHFMAALWGQQQQHQGGVPSLSYQL